MASSATVRITLPDLVMTAISDPPPNASPGGSFAVTDVIQNAGDIEIASTTTQYYLSLDGTKNAGDVLLAGTRGIPILGAGLSLGGGRTVTVPSTTPSGVYFLLSCGDDLLRRIESNEGNNCRASVATIQIGQ
jgi:subtilase family serine protease